LQQSSLTLWDAVAVTASTGTDGKWCFNIPSFV
jgi:hypothetical protein